ncbi:MAG: protoporphyrinogen oxidase [Bacteroidales bacterium]|nr:protoporphyrinogen oxidase [Bacteroidales bacterium]
MEKGRKTEYTVIGAGLTGLTLAFYLQKAGKTVIIVEREERTGGVINTVAEEGFVYETGPNTGVLGNPEIAELFSDLDGLCELETANPLSKNRWIWKSGQWHALPAGFIPAVSTPLFKVRDKFRILAEPLRKKGQDPFETLAALVKRRLGESFLDYAVDPFISGIYAGDPNTLVTRFALPKLYNLEQNYGSFIRGAIFKAFVARDDRDKKATREVFSARGGLKMLVNALEKAVGTGNIIKGCQLVSIRPAERGFITEAGGGRVTVSSDKVITTTGSYTLPALLPFIPQEKLLPVTRLRYAGVVQAIAGFKNWNGRDLNAFGGLVPSKENRPVLGILFPSSIFAGRAPEKGALLSVFLGGMKNPGMIEKSDAEIGDIVKEEIRETLQAVKGEPELLRVFRYMHAIPQYERSSEERLTCIDELQGRYPGLILAGNIRDGIGIADRVKQGRNLSKQYTP